MEIVISKKEFQTSEKLIEGLYHSSDIKIISENIKLFDIEFESTQTKQIIQSDITKRDNKAIITLKLSKTNWRQLLVTDELNIKNLKAIKQDRLSKDLKDIITQAFQMTQKPKNLGDFLK